MKAFDRVIGHEGGFQNDPNDPGNWTKGKIGQGELKGTKFGIAAASYPHVDIENLTLDQAKIIYYNDWWKKLNMSRFRPAMAYQMFDAAINHGSHNANRMLQRAVGVKDDGIIGPITMAAYREISIDNCLLRFLAERLEFFTRLNNFDKFGRGWSRRTAHNLRIAAEDNDS